ncbi:ferritin-like domain-containing protein [Fibrella sp. HMF5335]|uniref:Ferritin-like domain-containing protein n=1 Tax=Fibrella rubiginis TaxID=2817060 RepID=A0A939GD43_9BACT|nr:ferritin-like domain-containing protein [Fibrella rubiginis]MBO0936897.1 ferritin-like domain-containing protein [Fibrella rubiginis]
MANIGKQIADFFSGGSTTDNDEGLRGLFVSELQGMYYAEKALVDNMPNMADAATTDEVRQAFQHHLEETRGQVTRLERIFDSIGVSADDKTCNAIDGLADDADDMISMTESGSLTRDAGLIIAAQKVEHHEIAAYGSLHALAQLLGYTEAAQLIEQSLQEEKNTDKKLTQLAESFVNERAKSEGKNDQTYSSPNRRNYYDDNDNTGSAIDNSGAMMGTGSTSGSQSGYASGANYQSGSAVGETTSYGNSGSTDREPIERSGYSPGRESSSGNATSGGTLGI